MKRIVKIAKKYGVSMFIVVAVLAMNAVNAFAAPNTGNTDLDQLIGSMEDGLGFIKTGGLYVVSAVIIVAVVFLGSRWVWNMFRGWLAKAQ